MMPSLGSITVVYLPENRCKQHLEDFKALEFGSKVCLIGSWVTASGLGLLLCTSSIVVANWMQGDEPRAHIKKALSASIALTTGGALFVTGASLEDDRQSDLSYEETWKFFQERRALREASPCPNCRHLGQYCAMNPHVACTPEANNCTDFESKESK